MSKFKHTLYTILAVIVLSLPSFCQDGNNFEIKKASFIKNFSIFTQWPNEESLAETHKYFTICILGDTPAEKSIIDFFSGETIKEQPVLIKKINSIDDIDFCNILFITESRKDSLENVLLKTQNKAILTVSDTAGFSEKGIMINFFQIGSKLSFEINESAVKQSGLYMSHLLLKEAKIINPVNK